MVMVLPLVSSAQQRRLKREHKKQNGYLNHERVIESSAFGRFAPISGTEEDQFHEMAHVWHVGDMPRQRGVPDGTGARYAYRSSPSTTRFARHWGWPLRSARVGVARRANIG
jgi:hypothetical protein